MPGLDGGMQDAYGLDMSNIKKSTSSENQRSTQKTDDVKDCMFPYPSNIPIVLLLFGQCLE